jgi:hypothetical protein
MKETVDPQGSTLPTLRLPVYIVDDDAAEMTTYLRTLRRALPSARIELLGSLQEAERVLLDLSEPFLLIMDQNFEKSRDVDGSRQGTDLVALLRRQHVWGAFLPVLLLTGNFDDEKNTRLGQQLGWRTPTSWLHKNTANSGDLNLAETADIKVSFDGLPAYLTPGMKYLIGMLLHLDEMFAEQTNSVTSQQIALDSGPFPDVDLEWQEGGAE